MNPLSMLFGVGVALRNNLYDRGIFKVHKLARPVVSIGNISVGGSGKTPCVIALGELLKQRGIAFDVLSRGYGRKSTEIAVVDPSGTPEQFGDEPLLIARKLQVPVVVGASRYQAGLLAEKRFGSRLHVLDDGFQHRRLHRDFDLVLLPETDLTDKLLPAGRLRERPRSLCRADAVMLFGTTDTPRLRACIFRAQRVIELAPAAGKAVVFCAIARPAQFFAAVKGAGQEIAGEVALPDHHRYTQSDLDRLLLVKQGRGADFFVTTEKDLINLGPLAAQFQPLRVARLRLGLEDPEHFLSVILDTIEQRTGCRV
jgi:tetraacyldisaccharide 4'-kinase